jgi:MFS family permease
VSGRSEASTDEQFGVETTTGTYNVPAKTLTIWAAMFAFFQSIGQCFGGWQSDYFGRRFCIYSVVLWTYLGVTLEIIAHNWQMWTGAKIAIGFATGVMQSAVPTYVAEVAPRECRAITLGLCHLTGGYFRDPPHRVARLTCAQKPYSVLC